MALKSPEERFWTKVDKTNSNGCWLWKGTVAKKTGYGTFSLINPVRRPTAHRYSMMLAGMDETECTVVKHKCDNKLCVNPSHLEPKRGLRNTTGKVTKEFIISTCSPDLMTGCLMRTCGIDSTGYSRISDASKSPSVHRLMWELERGKIPDGMCVLHQCDNRRCCNIDHLFLGTKKDNADDCVAKGRNCFGTKNGNSKLTEMQLWEIRESSLPLSVLAKSYNVDRTTIWNVRTGRTYSKVC